MKKRPVGRPKMESYERKTEGIRIRLTAEEHTKLFAMAQNRGVSAATLIRMLLKKEYLKSGF